MTERKDYTPAVMSAVLLVGLGALAYVRHQRVTNVWSAYPVNLDVVFIALYAVWILAEGRIAKKDVDTQGKQTRDFATCQLYGAGQAATILSAVWFASRWNAPGAVHLAGIVLFILGVGFRWWAILSLGAFYSHRVRTVSDHRIVDTGPYRFVRHPAYAGMILAHAGVVLFFFNWFTLGAFGLVLFPAILLRIRVEERVLFGIPGYETFAASRARLVPGVW